MDNLENTIADVYRYAAIAGLLTAAMKAVESAKHLTGTPEEADSLQKLHDGLEAKWAEYRTKANAVAGSMKE